MPVNSIYEVTADLFLNLLVLTWESEAALAEAWAKAPFGSAVPFDRTKHGDALVRYLFNSSWRLAYTRVHSGATAQQAPRPVPVDVIQVAVEMLAGCDDYNLLSQVLPNLVPHTIILDKEGCKRDLFAIESMFDGILNPAPAAKVKGKGGRAKKPEADPSWDAKKQALFAKGIALTKTASTFDKFTPPSWRITPFGRTPALNDASGISNLPAMADPYVTLLPWINPLGEPVQTAYLTWDTGAQAVSVSPTEEPGTFEAVDLPDGRTKFVSESGGAMLGQVLLSRGLAYDAWVFWSSYCKSLKKSQLIPSFYVMAKLNSLRLVGSSSFMHALEQDLHPSNYVGLIPGLAWSWDQRAPLRAAQVEQQPLAVQMDDAMVWADDL